MINILPEYNGLKINENNLLDILIEYSFINNTINQNTINQLYIYIDNSIFSIGNEIIVFIKYTIEFLNLFNFTTYINIYSNEGKIYEGINDKEKIYMKIRNLECKNFNNFNQIYKDIGDKHLCIFSNNINCDNDKIYIISSNKILYNNICNLNNLIELKNIITNNIGTGKLIIKNLNKTIIKSFHNNSLFQDIIINNVIENKIYKLLITIEINKTNSKYLIFNTDILECHLYLNNNLIETKKKKINLINKNDIINNNYIVEFKNLLDIEVLYNNLKIEFNKNNYIQCEKNLKIIYIKIKKNLSYSDDFKNIILIFLKRLRNINFGEKIRNIEKKIFLEI